MKRNAKIAAIASYAPARVVPNQFFNDLLGEDVDTWLRENLTIRERRWCAEDESTADLAVRAAEKALQRAGVAAADLDLIIISTDTPEYVSPSTASVVQHRLGAVKAGTFDVNTACAGFVTVLDIGAKYIRADARYENVLVIGAYAMSKFLNLKDKKTVTLFADGAGAALLQATTEERGFSARCCTPKASITTGWGSMPAARIDRSRPPSWRITTICSNLCANFPRSSIPSPGRA